ncbi:hypothetical protein PINS_up015432 [Pythium insidiosum]|nr:hypothetical protein PINS_up015432 [Pythium insidiosum]
MLRRKRSRDDHHSTPHADGFDEIALHVDDTVSAMELALERNARGFASAALVPVIFWHQLYGLLPNRTFVDQNVQRLRRDGIVVCMKSPIDRNERLLVRWHDYERLVVQHEERLRAKRTRRDSEASKNTAADEYPEALEVFRAALSELSQQSPLTFSCLVRVLAQRDDNSERDQQSLVQKRIALLQRLGFLRPSTELEAEAYELSMPGLGKLITAVKKTRADLLAALRRTKHKEAFEHQLKKLKLRHSSFELEYHLSEMEGIGLIRRTRVTSGTLVALPRK